MPLMPYFETWVHRHGERLHPNGEPLVYWTVARDHQLMFGVLAILVDDLWGRLPVVREAGRWGRLVDLAGGYSVPDLKQVFLWVDGHQKGNSSALQPVPPPIDRRRDPTDPPSTFLLLELPEEEPCTSATWPTWPTSSECGAPVPPAA
ncbi:hypothetical protein FDA94_30300 [Herbidospora galbida]|uniref:Uncharacterized protein n=1 Tax=Herbidospora galbida TaxID=2575442 RepID=A0A4U3M5Q7_9ACTN|nr:hypothetical protein [Herbidospora galbida]TKK84218.1 hypothetical protein FDA94_30300 [Herbidospora galbida]